MEFAPIVFLLLFIPPLVLFIRRADITARVVLRPLRAFESLRKVLAQAAESGQPIHISVGVAGIGASQTAETAAGLETLEFLAERAAVSAIPPIVTVGDPTALPLAQDQLRRAYTREGYPEEYDPRRVRFVAPSVSAGAVPYAVGVMDIVTHENVFASVLVGSFGDEFLLMAEPAAQKNVLQTGGTNAPSVLPFVVTSVDQPLLGEEIYAAGAYLSRKAAHIASLLTQDIMRVLLVIAILVGVLLRVLGVL